MRAIALERDPDALLVVAAKACATALGADAAWVVAQSEHVPLASGSFGFEPGAIGPEVFQAYLFRVEDEVLVRGATRGDSLGLAEALAFENLVVARWAIEGCIGFVFVMNRPGSAFTDEDGELLSGLTAQIGCGWRTANDLLIARATHSVHRTLVEQLPAVTYYRALDKPGIPSFISPQVVELLGFSQEEVMGDAEFFKNRVHPDDREGISANQAAYRPAGTHQPIRVEYRLLHRDGSVRWVHNHALSVRDQADQARLVVGVIIDVTEQKLADQAKREVEKRLEEQLRQTQKLDAVGRLAGGIAHEFNNLLGVILGYTQMMQGRALDDATRADLAQVTEAAERAKRLTSQMLAFTGRQLVEPRIVDVGELVQGMDSLLTTMLGADITLSVSVEGDAHTTSIDPSELQQLLLNLVSNARDASPRGGKVDVSVARAAAGALAQPGAFVRVTVKDEGRGMTESTRLRVFEPFFTTKERGKGTGLGLSMALGVAKEAGGDITVDSSPDSGSVFSVFLPLVTARTTALPRRVSEQRLRAAAGPDTVAPRSSETILVVERRARATSAGMSPAACAWLPRARGCQRQRSVASRRTTASLRSAAHRCGHARPHRARAVRRADPSRTSEAGAVHVRLHRRHHRAARRARGRVHAVGQAVFIGGAVRESPGCARPGPKQRLRIGERFTITRHHAQSGHPRRGRPRQAQARRTPRPGRQ